MPTTTEISQLRIQQALAIMDYLDELPMGHGILLSRGVDGKIGAARLAYDPKTHTDVRSAILGLMRES
jgi:hypothetical protein